MNREPLFVVLDSGAGGLPYFEELVREYPAARCVYLADTEHFPYGNKTAADIIECAAGAVRKAAAKFAPDVIIIACNTISVTALDVLRARFPDIAFVGTVPAVKLAAAKSKKRRIGLLATAFTVGHAYTARLIADFAADCTVEKVAAPDLIDFIETKLPAATEEEIAAAIRPYTGRFRAAGVDVIVLACTHFLRITKEIKKAAGDDILIIDSREGVVHQALRLAGITVTEAPGNPAPAPVTAVEASGNAVPAPVTAAEASGNAAPVTAAEAPGSTATVAPGQSVLFVTGEAGERYRQLAAAFGAVWGGKL